jgi:hypothetical protein
MFEIKREFLGAKLLKKLNFIYRVFFCTAISQMTKWICVLDFIVDTKEMVELKKN